METISIIKALAGLAQESRLAIFRLLIQAGTNGVAAGKIAETLNIAPSSLSFHLKELSHAHLIESRQNGRFVIYSANFQQIRNLIDYLTENCCHGTSCLITEKAMNTKIYNVLFLCTGNSARSILAEALLNQMGRGKFQAFSAGSFPTGKVNPFALELLQKQGIDTTSFRSKSWDEFKDIPLDFVFTVCDNAAGEICPVWIGQPMTAHWGIEDPAAVEGTDDDKRRAFFKAFSLLQRRIGLFTSLPFEKLDQLALKQELSQIGQLSRNQA
jgi:ArsR family transcriptional regulator, arsenate/arsenite/antimonite-responsive transcriptional repressor / arsenate reductase (thioredoxin)